METRIKRPFPIKDEGRDYLIGYLKKLGFKDLQGTTDPYAHWDVEGTYKGEKWIFELKNRNKYYSDHYDAILEEDKVRHLLDTPYRAVFVNFWNDCWCMIQVKTLPYEVKNRWHRQSTFFDRQNDILTPQATWTNITKVLQY